MKLMSNIEFEKCERPLVMTGAYITLLELKLFDIFGARTDLGRRVAAHGASLRRRR